MNLCSRVGKYLSYSNPMSLKPVWPSATYALHQEEGIHWMIQQEKFGYVTNYENTVWGGILGDEMGLGKTIESLGLIINHKVKRTLIITPLAVRKQWEDVVAKCNLNLFTAERSSWKLHGLQRNRPSVFLGHYDHLVSNVELFKTFEWDRIILDEAHRIRNTKTVTGLSVLKLKGKYKWCLTATPIVNSLDDAVSYLKFIGCAIEDSGKWQPQYETWINHLYMARKLEECEPPAGLTMPPKPVIQTINLEFTNPKEESLYQGILNNLEHQWRKVQSQSGRAAALQKLAILLRLRQVSVNPQVYINARMKEISGWMGPEFLTASRKFEEISSLVREASEEGQHNWIIFCQFRDEINLLKKYLEAFSFIGKVREYHGGMSLEERTQAIQDSHKKSEGNQQDIFLIQLQAGGTGLNLQHYDRVIFSSPWWTAALMDQALGRALRIGQVNTVHVYWLHLSVETTFNIDQFIEEKATTKRSLAETFHRWSVTHQTQI